MAKTILIVDDSAVVRQAMQDVLSSDPHIEVVGSAPENGTRSLAKSGTGPA